MVAYRSPKPLMGVRSSPPLPKRRKNGFFIFISSKTKSKLISSIYYNILKEVKHINRKTLFIIIAVILISLSGCTKTDEPVPSADSMEQTEKNQNIQAEEKPVILESIGEVEMPVNIYDPQYLIDTEDCIAIVKVSNIHGENYNELTDEYVSPYTVGNIDVVYPIKGEPRQTSLFTRMGARISFDKYLEGLPETERSKVETILVDGTRPDYVDYSYVDCLMLEDDQYYLVFMIDSNYVIKDEHYSICWYPAGTLKIEHLDEDDYLNSTVIFREKEMTIKEYLNL